MATARTSAPAIIQNMRVRGSLAPNTVLPLLKSQAAGHTGCNRPNCWWNVRALATPHALDDCIGRFRDCK